MESHDPLVVGVCDDFTDHARQPAEHARAAQVLTEAGHILPRRVASPGCSGDGAGLIG
ncbi:hypothetical protein [Actinomadura rubrisoli]|uniref:hypothetical protein n=1 Tax=Actinomadura rubrisoli TaxID=2530368 RepID=UPI0014052A97|nr:hypothetical protein [Actinomadura rubrisoli]